MLRFLGFLLEVTFVPVLAEEGCGPLWDVFLSLNFYTDARSREDAVDWGERFQLYLHHLYSDPEFGGMQLVDVVMGIWFGSAWWLSGCYKILGLELPIALVLPELVLSLRFAFPLPLLLFIYPIIYVYQYRLTDILFHSLGKSVFFLLIWEREREREFLSMDPASSYMYHEAWPKLEAWDVGISLCKWLEPSS